MLSVKQGVRLYGLQPEMLFALDRAQDVLQVYGADAVLTSGRGDKHGQYSHHFKGLAIDLRSRDIDKTKHESVREHLQSMLGGDYQVIAEKDHFHIEFDPAQNPAYLSTLPS